MEKKSRKEMSEEEEKVIREKIINKSAKSRLIGTDKNGIMDLILSNTMIDYTNGDNNNTESGHHKICSELFKEIESDEFFVYIDNCETYMGYNNNEKPYFEPFINQTVNKDSEALYYLHCSIVTYKMLDYDYTIKHLREKRILEYIGYKPYFIEFVIPVYEDGKSKCNIEIGENIKQELLDFRKPHWFKARYINEAEKENSKAPYVNGKLVECASPINFKEGCLEIVDANPNAKDIEKKINEIYAASSFASSNEVNTVLANRIKQKLDIARAYNVGHGNFLYLKSNDDKTNMIYDIGYITELQNRQKRQANKAAILIKPSIVIISHWDSDHYYGAYANKELMEVPWIAPDCAENGYIAAKRLIRFLKYSNEMYLVERLHSTKPSVANNQPFAELILQNKKTNAIFKLEIYRGSGKETNITSKNCEGLVVKITNGDIITLMCGDVPYSCLPDTLTNKKCYNYLIVPHHCREMSVTKLKSIYSVENAIICEGDKVANNHYDTLSNDLKSDIHFTYEAKLSIDFRLDESKPIVIVNCGGDHI